MNCYRRRKPAEPGVSYSPKPPEALLWAIAHDLKPVRPAPDPLHLALRMVPLALLCSSLIMLAIGPRRDLTVLGPLLAWSASAAQFVLAIALVWIAARESTPWGRLPATLVYVATVAAFPLLPVPAWVNEKLRIAPWIAGFTCGIGSTLAGGILVLFFSWIFRNSLATRPAMAGALYGAGLAINSGRRIACPFSAPSHALGAHGAAIVATVILGALIGRFLGNRKMRVGG